MRDENSSAMGVIQGVNSNEAKDTFSAVLQGNHDEWTVLFLRSAKIDISEPE